MKQILLLAVCLLSLLDNSFGQTNGSFYTLQIGKKTCLFRYTENPDSIYVETDSAHSKNIVTQINPITLAEKIKWVKDTIAIRKSLTLMDSSAKTFHTKRPIKSDTVSGLDPITLQLKTKVVNFNEADYHIESTMSYSDFLILLKSKFELKNPQKKLRVYSYSIYYETPDTAGSIYIEYPQTSEGVISKLNCLEKNGGFILLSISEADHGLVKIDTGASFLALIRIKN